MATSTAVMANTDATMKESISMKITTLVENLDLLLENTITGSTIYTMNEKINFLKLTQTQYHNLIFEQELFDILLKNNYAINNTDASINRAKDINPNDITYANIEYPFSLMICSKQAYRSSILINNSGLVLIKFILYLRMLNQTVVRPDCPNCFLAINMKLLPFGRICIDVDFKVPVSGDHTEVMDDEEYEKFIVNCFNIVCEMTTSGNVIMTTNCFTPKPRSFHLITEQQFDAATRQVIFIKISEKIRSRNAYVKIDQVHVWMLPFGQGHTPVRKYNRQNNEFVKLAFPYTEMDFELTMPFDLNLGIDNLHTLLKYAIHNNDNNEDLNDDQYDALNEYLNDEIVHSYYVQGVNNMQENLQLYAQIPSFKYDFAFKSQSNYRFEHNYLPKVLENKYNNFFLMMSNKKLLLENNWQIPRAKIQQRPTEFYEIYRFISHKLLKDLNSMDELFELMPKNLVKKNVKIDNDDEIVNEGQINAEYTGEIFNLSVHDSANNDVNLEEYIQPASGPHPWPYMTENAQELSPNASTSIKSIYEFFRKTILDNVYIYEKGGDNVMKLFHNIQSRLSNRLDYFTDITNKFCKVVIGGDTQKIQNYMFPLYEFFCRIHYIDACITTEEYQQLQKDVVKDTLKLNMSEQLLDKYRKNYIEMSPCKKAYRNFPMPNTPLSKIWDSMIPENKIIVHIIYLLMVEHNYTSIFIYLHNLSETNDITYLICSFLLNIIDESYIDNSTGKYVYSYASKEFLNFIYRTFINAGTNIQGKFKNDNVQFDMANLQLIIADLQAMFIGSPIWFFLTNFQYMDENLDFTTRFDLFTQIFQQEQQRDDENGSYGRRSGKGRGSNRRGGGGGGNRGHQQQYFMSPPPAKQAKKSKTINFNPDKYFKIYNINETYHGDLLAIFYKYIIVFCSTENGEYIYDGARFRPSTLPSTTRISAQIVRDPVKYATIYRHQYGIYNTWTMQFERNTSVLYTHISISNDEFSKYPELFNAYNDDIYQIMVNRFLKSITFTRVLNYQKNLALLLAPIYDPNAELTTNTETLNYNIDCIQINIHDLSSCDYILPDQMLLDILKTKNKFYEMFKWLYAVICHYSEKFSCNITTPSSFIPKCMLQEMNIDNTNTDTDIETSYSFYPQQITKKRYTRESDVNKWESPIQLQRIHKILNSKKREQQQNITDGLQKLIQHELTSLLILFDNISNCDELASSSSSAVLKNNNDREDINKFNLSTSGALTFYADDENMENSKNELLLNLFNRKLSKEISEMTLENFQKIIDENFSQHIIKFVLLTLSWFIRTTHTHLFSESIFFREIRQHRQQLYDELADLTFKHNGYFMYNNSIVDITNIFGYYCRHISLVVDPNFVIYFPVDRNDIYLGYDLSLENRVSREIIKDIEAACVSAIYQGQFIENTNVDLNRLWARVTVPGNKHRILPLLNLHKVTGKSEYLMERCRKHFNNNDNNYLTLFKSSDFCDIDMARILNENLIVCIEDFSNFSTKKFKQIRGNSSITYKPLWANTESSFQNNATVILSSNNHTKCTEAAVFGHLHVYPRRIQYANVNKYIKFQRTTATSTATLLNTNNIFAVQLIIEKMPCMEAENYKGNFMMTWILKRFFLYNIIDAVTAQASQTLQNHIESFQNMINAPQLVLERLKLNTGEMPLFQFRNLVNRICEENRNLFNSKIDTYNVFAMLNDKLKGMINNETQTIRVTERAAK